MNRIILVGNGFDLAHDMETSYRHFIDDYWKTFIDKAKEKKSQFYEDEKKNVIFKTNTKSLAHIISYNVRKEQDYNSLLDKIESFKNSIYGGSGTKVELIFNNKFLEQISKHVGDKNWVDIENEYYEKLKKCSHDEAVTLNREFAQIEKLLNEYLKGVQKKKEVNFFPKDEIIDRIYSPIELDDLSNSKGDDFIKYIIHEAHRIKNNEYSNCQIEVKGFVDKLVANRQTSIDQEGGISRVGVDYVRRLIKNRQVPDDILKPSTVFFLNFNYTQTINRYARYGVTYIHGELNNEKNPMIFGYGDELAEDYKKIEELNDNEYLKNVKSIRYLDTDNYRRLLSFIESEPYQVFVMGHSCGNSDRTLLNTLFEHKNCVSIKPFYHQKSETEDNYREIVQNISRNFKDKALMRERVVNKTYCEPLTKYVESK